MRARKMITGCGTLLPAFSTTSSNFFWNPLSAWEACMSVFSLPFSWFSPLPISKSHYRFGLLVVAACRRFKSSIRVPGPIRKKIRNALRLLFQRRQRDCQRQPWRNSGRSTYSLTVWISFCPAPMVTVGTPCLRANWHPGRRWRTRRWLQADRFRGSLGMPHRRRFIFHLEGRVRGFVLELHFRRRSAGVLHFGLRLGERLAVCRGDGRGEGCVGAPRSPLMWT